MKRKPVICITSEHGSSPPSLNTVPMFYIDKRYGHAIASAGGVPITPLDINSEERYCEMSDALLLIGGHNIHPARYGTPFLRDELARHTNFFNDNMDFDLFAAFLAAGKPIFGIGRGMQLINVALGGTLFQDLLSLKKAIHWGGVHEITIHEDTFLAQQFGTKLMVNSRHQQAVDKIGDGLKVVATAADGIVEAVQHESKAIYGVQFHPEITYTPDSIEGKQGISCTVSLFDYIVKLAAQ